MNRRWIALAAFAVAQGAVAQTATPTATAGAGEAAPGEIIVTAQKRAERLQDVPVAVQALSAEALERAQVVNVTDLARLAPSFRFVDNFFPGGQTTYIRGVGTLSLDPSIEQSVSTVVDGVVLGRQGMQFADLFDLERVEVLRGPQGTLFGKNSSAGVVNIITRDPTDVFEGAARLSYGRFDEWRASATVSGPLAPGVSARLTGFWNRRDGEVRNIILNRDVNGRESWGVRGKLRFELSERTALRLIGDYSDARGDCCAWTFRTTDTTAIGGRANPALAAIIGRLATPSPDNRVSIANLPPRQTSKNRGVSAQLDHEVDGGTLTAISAWRRWNTSFQADADQTPLTIVNSSGRTGVEQWTQELRFANDPGGAWDVTAGLFGFWLDVRPTSNTFAPGPAPGVNVSIDVGTRVRTANIAVFGQATRSIDDRLFLTVGGRLLRETLRANFSRTVSFVPAVIPPIPFAIPQTARIADTAVTWTANARYQFTPDVGGYASVSRGYKGQAFNLDSQTPIPVLLNLAANRIRPEIPTSFELGLRTQTPDRRLTVNVTAFHSSYKDFQGTGFDAVTQSFPLINLGLKSSGVEVEVAARPAEGWNIGGGVTYARTRYSDFPNAACPVVAIPGRPCRPDGTVDLSGLQSPSAPRWSYVVNTDYSLPLGDALELNLAANWSWRSAVVYEINLDPGDRQEAYGTLDLRAALRGDDGRWELAAWGRNVFDRDFATFIFRAPVFEGGAYSQFPGPQRAYGVELTARF